MWLQGAPHILSGGGTRHGQHSIHPRSTCPPHFNIVGTSNILCGVEALEHGLQLIPPVSMA